jgi:hypothetical protein
MRVSSVEIGSQVVRHLTHRFDSASVELLVLDATARPWVAAALVDALRRSGWQLPIIFLSADAMAACDATVLVGRPIDVDQIARIARALVAVS